MRAGLVVAVRFAPQVLRGASAVLRREVLVRFGPEAGRARVVHGSIYEKFHPKVQGLGRAVAAPRRVAAAARRAPGVLVRAVRVACSMASPRRRPLDSRSESQSDLDLLCQIPPVRRRTYPGLLDGVAVRAAAFCCFVIGLSISLGPVVTVLELVGGLVWDSGRRTGRWSRRVLSPRRTPWLACAIPTAYVESGEGLSTGIDAY